MKKGSNILLKLVFPIFILGFIVVAQTQAADNAGNNVNEIKDMPSAPVGPYRSTHDFNKASSAKQLDSRQWTLPAPSHWVQKHAVPQHDSKIKDKERLLKQSTPTAQAVARPVKNKQWNPSVPPQWGQQQRRQMQQPVPPQWSQQRRQTRVYPPVPPQWNQQRRHTRVYPPVPPQWSQQRRQTRVYPSAPPRWVQPQHRQMQYYPLVPSPWVQRQRRQAPIYPSIPFSRRQQGVVAPNFYNYPPVWGRAPYPQYRR